MKRGNEGVFWVDLEPNPKRRRLDTQPGCWNDENLDTKRAKNEHCIKKEM